MKVSIFRVFYHFILLYYTILLLEDKVFSLNYESLQLSHYVSLWASVSLKKWFQA